MIAISRRYRNYIHIYEQYKYFLLILYKILHNISYTNISGISLYIRSMISLKTGPALSPPPRPASEGITIKHFGLLYKKTQCTKSLHQDYRPHAHMYTKPQKPGYILLYNQAIL